MIFLETSLKALILCLIVDLWFEERLFFYTFTEGICASCYDSVLSPNMRHRHCSKDGWHFGEVTQVRLYF